MEGRGGGVRGRRKRKSESRKRGKRKNRKGWRSEDQRGSGGRYVGGDGRGEREIEE